MNEEGGFPILPFLIGTVILAYFGLEITRQRNKLRAIFNVVRQAGKRHRRGPGTDGRKRRAQTVRPGAPGLIPAPTWNPDLSPRSPLFFAPSSAW